MPIIRRPGAIDTRTGALLSVVVPFAQRAAGTVAPPQQGAAGTGRHAPLAGRRCGLPGLARVTARGSSRARADRNGGRDRQRERQDEPERKPVPAGR